MVACPHLLDAREFEQALGVGDGQTPGVLQSYAVTEPDKTERWHNSPVHGGMKVQVSPHPNHTLGIGICS